ncbi:hypothetical protein R5R35_009345 [Gryllus longicercus]|uniref:Uncharacterized protein n=1 Tax=Gryllus longicercus TaxID=2509291 RepID=A0AAN9Z1Q6_9ORTH
MVCAFQPPAEFLHFIFQAPWPVKTTLGNVLLNKGCSPGNALLSPPVPLREPLHLPLTQALQTRLQFTTSFTIPTNNTTIHSPTNSLTHPLQNQLQFSTHFSTSFRTRLRFRPITPSKTRSNNCPHTHSNTRQRPYSCTRTSICITTRSCSLSKNLSSCRSSTHPLSIQCSF